MINLLKSDGIAGRRWLLAAWIVFGGFLPITGNAQSSTDTLWPVARLEAAPPVLPAPAAVPVPAGVKALFFEGVPFRGKPTRVFAFYGVPAGADAAHPVPGIVLVHGAGGTAFAEWVQLWVKRGYAAIAIDTEGHLPVGKYDHWQTDPEGGPRRQDIPQLTWPVTDQWMYHAVADTILANSLLRSLPGVDPERIGLTGISWGGVVVSTVAGVDARFKFVAPVYGCGHIADESADGSTFVGAKATPEQRAAWKQLWDPANFLPQAKMPMLWVTGTNDFAFTMRNWQLSYQVAPGPRTLSLHVRMPHSQGVGESPEEIRVFADSIVRGGAPLPKILQQGRADGTAWIECDPASAVSSAVLNYTADTGRWQDRRWQSAPAQLHTGKAEAVLPAGVAVYYFELIDAHGISVSGEPVILSNP